MKKAIFENHESFFSQFRNLLFKKGEIVLRPDSITAGIFYIKDGFVQEYSISSEGEQITCMIYQKGDIFPICAVLGDCPNDHYFEALTPVSVYKAPVASFSAYVNQNPKILYELTLHIINSFGLLLESINDIAVGSAYDKVLSKLVFLATNFGQRQEKNILIPIPLTHENIANSLGVTRETTSIQMGQLEKRGFIEYKGNFIVLKISKLLKQFSERFNFEDESIN